MISPSIRNDFPIFSKKKMIYLDSACTTLKPKQVIDEVVKYYSEYSGCAGRSLHKIGKEAEEAFEHSREKIAKFVHADERYTVFTKNTTEALNLLAFSFPFKERRKVVTTILEHHSAFLPFQRLWKLGEIDLEVVNPAKDGTFSIEQFENTIDSNTALVVIHHSNNTVGTSPPLREIVKLAHENGCYVVVDGAQGVPHKKIDFKREGFDFLGFSGHKMLGPTGIGCAVMSEEFAGQLSPFIIGGETIKSVTLNETVFADPPQKFEGGIQHYAGAIGLGAAVEYLERIGMEEIEKHERELVESAFSILSGIENVIVYGPRDANKCVGIVTFNVGNASPHEVAVMLDEHIIEVRSGVFCAEPAMDFLGARNGAVRASLYLYNTLEEVKRFGDVLREVVGIVG